MGLRTVLGAVALGLILVPRVARSQEASKPGLQLGAEEYEGWRQYSVHCARCHGQDVLGNPVAADLLVTTAPGGSSAEPEVFAGIVKAGRPARGMPTLGPGLTDEQIAAIYAYVRGRAEQRIPPGRPRGPSS